MNTSLYSLRNSLVAVAAAALLAACAEGAPLGPEHATSAKSASTQAPVLRSTTETGLERVDLGVCDTVQVPANSSLILHAYATGVQIYQWTGTSWNFVAPSATLYGDAGLNGVVATHFAGPTWQSPSGSTVVASTTKRCTPDRSAIPWLLLTSVSTNAPGLFDGTKYVQRLKTVGGLAPSTPGSSIGQEAKVPYTAEYLFYREIL